MVAHVKDREPRWSKEVPSRLPTGRAGVAYVGVNVAFWAFIGVVSGLFSPSVGAFFLGLFVIAVLRRHARTSGSRSRWWVWSIAWVLAWGAFGALSLALDWGKWLGYGALAIAFVALVNLLPQREVETTPDAGADVVADRWRGQSLVEWCVALASAWVVVWLMDGFTTHGNLAVLAEIALVIGVGALFDFAVRRLRRARLRQDNRLD